MTDMGKLHYYLGIQDPRPDERSHNPKPTEVHRGYTRQNPHDYCEFWVHLSKAMCPQTQAERDEMAKVPYRSAVGSLLYAALHTKPDIARNIISVPQSSRLDQKVFGCLAYYFIGLHKRKKLDTRANFVIFIGYAEKTKAYGLYEFQKHIVVLSRNVVFDESKLYKGRFSVSDSGFYLATVSDSETQAEATPMSDNAPTVDISHEGVTQHADLDVGQCVPALQGIAAASNEPSVLEPPDLYSHSSLQQHGMRSLPETGDTSICVFQRRTFKAVDQEYPKFTQLG
ncbi:hypothetical protein V1520DRAFT_385870 [Lipomyces starkeyi]